MFCRTKLMDQILFQEVKLNNGLMLALNKPLHIF